MVSSRLHAACGELFLYLRQGRIFHRAVPPSTEWPESRRREYFWLCQRCSTRVTVVIKDGVGTVQPSLPRTPERRSRGASGRRNTFRFLELRYWISGRRSVASGR